MSDSRKRKGYRVEPPEPQSFEAESEPSAAEAELPQPQPVAAAAQARKPVSSRRRFFQTAWGMLFGLAALEYVWVAISFLRPRSSLAEQGGIVVAGPAQNFEPGTVTAFQRGKFYLSRLENGGFLALSRECTHLGCTVPWNEKEGRFVCPCHASAYNERGEVVSPPAPRPLDHFPIWIENGVVKVDTSEPEKRLAFDDTQVAQS